MPLRGNKLQLCKGCKGSSYKICTVSVLGRKAGQKKGEMEEEKEWENKPEHWNRNEEITV